MKGANTVHALDEANCWTTSDPSVIALEMIDIKKRSFVAAMNTSGIVAVIGKLLDIAHDPILGAASASPPAQCSIDGTRLELAPGRVPTECAARLTIGCVQMVVFLPLEEVLRAAGELIQTIEPTPPGQGQPH